MSDFPWLTLLVLLPLVGSVVVAVLPSGPGEPRAKQLGLGFAGATLLVGLAVLVGYEVGGGDTTSLGGGAQFTETVEWIGFLGAHWALGVDGLSLLMVVLTVVLVPLVMLASWRITDRGNTKAFFGWALALEALSLAVFLATDVFLFYVVFEATLIPAYFLVSGFGQPGRTRAAVKFLLFQLAGGLVLLAGVIGLYVVSADAGNPSFLVSDLAALEIGPTAQKWLFVSFFFAFAVKAPLFPVHTWLADTSEKALTGTSVLLVCILDKIGTYGMLRFCLGLFPEASQWATPVVVTLALISVVYGALVAIGQDDVLRLVGLTSLSHFGLIVLGIFVLSPHGSSAAVLYMVNHGLATAALFLLAGFVVQRTGTTSIRAMGGLEKVTPVLAGCFLVAGLATLGLPGLSPFVSEVMVFIAAFDHSWWVGAIAVTAIVWAAVYVLWTYQRTMTGATREAYAGLADLDRRELGAVVPLLVAMVFFGFVPQPLLDVINPAVDSLIERVGADDDPPTVVPAGADAGTEATAEGGSE